MSHLLQGGDYSPLPQHLSDSDSEKELSMDPVCPGYGNHSMQNGNMDKKSFSQNGHLNFGDMNDDILKIKRVNPKMSPLRKVAFVFSILLCFLPIIIFLWVLPCSESDTCPIKISNWENQQEDIELKGKINLVYGVFKNNYNLAMLYKGSLNLPNNQKYGAISFMGNNGAVAWYLRQNANPIDMDCSIIDVDGNGHDDCLIIDEIGLKAVETVTGEIVWHVHSHDEGSALTDLELPIKLPDLNNDNINELLAVYQGKGLLLVCGKTGKALDNIKVNCNDILNLQMYGEFISYICRNGTKQTNYTINFNEIREKQSNPDHNIRIVQVPYEKPKEQYFVTGNRKLYVRNSGACPNCSISISLCNDKDKRIKSWQHQYSYVMTPRSFSFQSTPANIASLKGHINGFILKIWQWSGLDSKKKIASTSKVFKRSVPAKNESYYLNVISERVVLITFNDTDVRVINASSADVNQICIMEDKEFIECQPNYENQEESLLIADLDKDGSQELISYTSNYVNGRDDNEDSWHLNSILKVFRLEGELPKLYGSK